MPPTRLPTTPRPRQNASTTTRPSPSEREGSTSTVASSSARATSGVVERLGPARLRGELGDERSRHVAKRAAADEVQRRLGHARSGEPPRVGEHVDRLVALEHADEERRRAGPGAATRSSLEERLEVHERRELRGRLDAGRADEPGGVRGDRPDAVAPAQPEAGERVGERRERRAAPRPVQPCGRGRVAVDVRDHACRHARERAPQDRERRLLRALREHGVGSERAQLARDAKRQQRVEAGPSSARGRTDGTSRKRGSSPSPPPRLASTRTSSSSESASNFCASEGESGSE